MSPGGGYRPHSIDANHHEILQAYRRHGCTYVDLAAVGKTGCPDLLLGLAGITFLSETKTATGKLSKGQADWHQTWRGALVFTVRTPEDVHAVCVRIRQEAAHWAARSTLTVSPVARRAVKDAAVLPGHAPERPARPPAVAQASQSPGGAASPAEGPPARRPQRPAYGRARRRETRP